MKFYRQLKTQIRAVAGAASAVFLTVRLFGVIVRSRFRNRHYTQCTMMADSALQAKGNAIYQDTTTDLSASIGKLVTFSAGVPAVSASATVPAVGIVLDARKRTPIAGGTSYYDNAIGILGLLPGPVRVLISATATKISFGDALQQSTDGTLTNDAGSGARLIVGICTDENGAVAGDLAEVSLFAPIARGTITS